MTDNVIQFKPHEPEPHASGHAICTHCNHTWTAVAPLGTTILDCPECDTAYGIWRGPFAPSKGDTYFRCHCGSDLFYLTPDEIVCRLCGIDTVI